MLATNITPIAMVACMAAGMDCSRDVILQGVLVTDMVMDIIVDTEAIVGIPVTARFMDTETAVMATITGTEATAVDEIMITLAVSEKHTQLLRVFYI